MCAENPKALKQVERGAMAFGDAQNALWSAMLTQMQENEKYGVIVPTRLTETKKDVDKNQILL